MYLPGLKVVFDTLLESFALDLHRRDDESVAQKVRGVADAFTCAEAKASSITLEIEMSVRISPNDCLLTYVFFKFGGLYVYEHRFDSEILTSIDTVFRAPDYRLTRGRDEANS